ncbi:MAG: NADH-quinone oxidoreductase subunit NuoF [bacterium]|jgi:NADH:ubiquinone oxidoreductase subunit F (NADH-binding)/(2Fe-2S) ferredoxin/Pyruvate/2-oxoacid:ferredoxin oxidoreductase delta subunit|nr:NADH-quinone oxidoreductase subunit NuoF [bacterium]
MQTFQEILSQKSISDKFVEIINDRFDAGKAGISPDMIRALKSRLSLEAVERPVVMIGMGTCGLANGAQAVYDKFEEELKSRGIDAELTRVGCVGYCAEEVIVDVKVPGFPRISYKRVTPENVGTIIERTINSKEPVIQKALGKYPDADPALWSEIPLIHDIPFFKSQKKIVLENCGVIDPESIDQYLARGGYSALSNVLRNKTPYDVIKDTIASGLRGRGGGGFPTGKKWEFAYKAQGDQKYLICNADEGDPGAFMDRAVLEGDPHRVVEGMIIAAYAIGASVGYIYCRAEYPLAISRLEKTIADATAYGLLGKNILKSGFNFTLKIKKGAGAFVCGEETALIHSIEGKRGMPRPRPPFPAVSGLFGKPTIINNVETLANVPVIFNKGVEQYAAIGTGSSKGTKIFALSGKVVNTGLVEVPMGTTIRQIIFDIGGGVPDGRHFKAVQIGGPSGGALPEQFLDTEIDYENLKKAGAMMGSGGMVVMDEKTCMVDLAKYFMQFITSESCGKCIPCREGTKRLLEILERITKSYREEETEVDSLMRFQGMLYLERLASVIKDTSLCGLGQTAANPVISTLRYFRDEYEAHLYERTCPSRACRQMLTYTIIPEKCTGCTLCAMRCPVEAISGNRKEAHFINQDICTHCGQCELNCRFDAILAE